ncbi:hypothetical protein SORBI_3007G149950 [Sorghum bicolor]|uniref:Uncharacterized protein n=1 Tax=Sorghum bicolor TaxID=4558 RepID=A0A1Z5RAY9_SORBI|nr:hypothetical protein SORBI_3007G149950 [Sorghum bicolor]
MNGGTVGDGAGHCRAVRRERPPVVRTEAVNTDDYSIRSIAEGKVIFFSLARENGAVDPRGLGKRVRYSVPSVVPRGEKVPSLPI